MMGRAPWLALASPSAERGGRYGAATSHLHRWVSGGRYGAAMSHPHHPVSSLCPVGHAAKAEVALSHLVGRQIWEGRKLNLDEAKPLEKAVGVLKCPRKAVPG